MIFSICNGNDPINPLPRFEEEANTLHAPPQHTYAWYVSAGVTRGVQRDAAAHLGGRPRRRLIHLQRIPPILSPPSFYPHPLLLFILQEAESEASSNRFPTQRI